MKRIPSASPRSQRGGTFLGFVLGLVTGLAVAVGVALFITKAPVPFVNRPSVKADSEPIGSAPPDPNKPFYSRETPMPAQPPGSATVTAPAPAPAAATPAAPPAAGQPQGDRQFSFYDLMPGRKPGETPAAPTGSAAAPAPAAAPESRYLLQAGAFRNEADADAMRARLALLGYDARVSPREGAGDPIYRVRIGPVVKLDDLNRMRQTLAQNGIDASVVRAQ
ncbi:SPOR domain-containing protein [Derxia lacustris]|uniref:SPOR domain-containing protein n=1 Tax=Derxia lacustris TaxID=764842 RepID=UPI000A16DB18|nr:SPOR domain-containing protein [Derxia lacustris]